MSSALIFGIVTIGLFLLVIIAVTQQTLEKNAKEKRRLESAVNARVKNIADMLDGFPEGLLTQQLQILLYSRHRELLTQLASLDPRNASYTSELASSQQRLLEYQANPTAPRQLETTDKQQLHGIEILLGGLLNLVATLADRKKISAEDTELYSQQIRRLMIQVANHALVAPTQQAIDKGKPRLALHYLQAAKLKMQQEDEDFYREPINQLDSRIQRLEQQALSQEKAQQQGKHSAQASDEDSDNWPTGEPL